MKTSGFRRAPDSVARGKARSSQGEGEGAASPHVTGYRWAAAARAAASLQSPGWQVTVETDSHATIIWYGILVLSALALIHVLFAIRIARNSRPAVRQESFPRSAVVPPMLSRLAVHHDFRPPAPELQPSSEPYQQDLSTSQPLFGGLDPIWPKTVPDEHESAAPRDGVPENEPPVDESHRGTPGLPEFLEVEWSEGPDAEAPQNRNTDADEHRFPGVSSSHTG